MASQIQGFLVDFRKFAKRRREEDILIKDIIADEIFSELAGRAIFDIHVSFANAARQSYNLELLVLVECINPPDDMQEEHFKLFGVLMEETYTGSDEGMNCAFKNLRSPLMRRSNHICGFFKMHRNVSLVVFDDGVVWTLDSEDNKGVIHKQKLKLPFEKAVDVFFECEHQILMLQNEKRERLFFHYDNN